jgi:hypothetical protein
MYQPWFWPLIQICVIALILQIVVIYYDLNKKNIISYKKFKEYVEVSIKIQHINFIAGQYMIFKFNIDNKIMLRAFSFSNNVEKDDIPYVQESVFIRFYKFLEIMSYKKSMIK